MSKQSENLKSESRYSWNPESTDTTSVSQSKQITITVKSIENIDENKVQEVTVVIDFNENFISRSPSIPIENKGAVIDLTAVIPVEDVTPQFMNELLCNPVLFTVQGFTRSSCFATMSNTSPVLNKDSKIKTSKSSISPKPASRTNLSSYNVVGICNLDLSQLVAGCTKIQESLFVEPDRKIPPTEAQSWTKLPVLVVVASTGDEPLIPNFLEKYTIAGVTIESVYNVPEYVSEGAVFEASIPIPTIGDKTNKIKFTNGLVTSNKDFCCRKKWTNLSHLDGPGARSKFRISPDACEVFSNLPENTNIGKLINGSERTMQWNTWNSFLMDHTDVSYFFSKLMKFRMWPIEIFLPNKLKEHAQKEKSAKSDKKSKTQPSAASSSADHFTGFLNLSPLLYPGAKKIRVATQLKTYSAAELTGIFGSEFVNSLAQSSISEIPSKARTASDKKTLVGDSEENKDGYGTPVFNEEEAPTFIIVELEFSKPFCPKKNLKEIEGNLINYLSLSAKLKKKNINLGMVEKDFSHSIMNAVHTLSLEYQKFLSLKSDVYDAKETADTKFHEFLIKEKDFYSVKMTLKNKIVDLIKERFGHISNYENKVPEIYIYLVSEMHKITNALSLKEEVTATHFNDCDLQYYAEEAFEEGNFQLAKEYLLLKISRNPSNPNSWVDLAIYLVKLNKYEEAIEAAKEALCLDFYNQIGLLMYALLMVRMSNEVVAEMAFEILLSKYPNFIEGWMSFRLFFLLNKRSEGAIISLQQAKALMCEKKNEDVQSVQGEWEDEKEDEFSWKKYPKEDKYEAPREEEHGAGSFRNGVSWAESLSWTITLCPPNNLHLKTTVLMLRLGFYDFAGMCLSEELLTVSNLQKLSAPYVYYLSVNNYLQGQYEEAILILQNFVKEYGKECFMWSLLGHCFYKLENHPKAVGCYEYVMESYNRPDDIHLIYFRMGFYYLQVNKLPCAKKVFMAACKYSPTPKVWNGIGIACLMMEELEEAEIAFSESNQLNNQDPDTWGYLALTNSMLGRLDLFHQCFLEAKKRGLNNQDLIKKIKCCAVANGIVSEEF